MNSVPGKLYDATKRRATLTPRDRWYRLIRYVTVIRRLTRTALTATVLVLGASESLTAIGISGSVEGLEVEGFEGVEGGSYVVLGDPDLGISFGEKLLGQAVSTVPGAGVTSDLDEINGTPTVPLTRDSSVPQELSVLVSGD